MDSNIKHVPLRILILITTPKLSEKAVDMFRKGAVPIQYQWNAVGTASSEMIDILGLGTPDKRIIISILPKPFADDMLKKLKTELRIGAVNSGIAFTLPMSGVNNLIFRLLENLNGGEMQLSEAANRKDEIKMADMKYALVVAVVNQGYSEEVMDVAKKAGASGGTVVPGRRIGNQEAMGFWGMGIQEEKEMLFIIIENENKLKLMQAIGEHCGIHSEAKGLVVSLPIDSVIGLEEKR
ncbi:MAG: hypothetical protein J6C19_04520 [Lachnospiraceae bacterium]|nr:hypothetical protein [Lachnospiraceae bacterium]MBO5144783.1 hypothetical protein [Lachnospiraceae bacterium]